MAKFINDIHEFIDFLTGKGQTGYHTPEEIDNAVHVASRELFNEMRKVFEQTRIVTTDLIPFFSDPTQLTLTNGQATYPPGFKYTASFSGGPNGRPIKEVDKAMLANKINDPLCPPSADYGVCVYYKNHIQFYPTNISNVEVAFLKEPVKPVWAYTVVNGRYVYDDTSSVDIEWGEQNHNQIMMRALSHLGINLRENELMQFAEIQKKETE